MRKAIVFLLVVAFAWACADHQPGSSEKTACDPAPAKGVLPRSELALTMRDMYDKMKLASDSLKQGYRVNTSFLDQFKTIHTAEATEPEKIDEAYHAMAELFLRNYEQFEAGPEDQTAAFNAMIESCLACHQQQCPGPVKIINRLRVK